MSESQSNWDEEREGLIRQIERINTRFQCVFRWLELLENGADLQPYFQDHGCSRIAIYGVAEIGEILLKEIERNNMVKVAYFIDRNAENQRDKSGIPVYMPEEFADLPDVDMVVVTAIFAYEKIESTLLQIRPEIPVVSLNTIVEVRGNEAWYEQR